MPDQWTPRVTARAELATLLKTKFPDRATGAGLTPADLDTLIDQGKVARDADVLQKEQLAEMGADRTARKVDAEQLFSREDELRDRLPAVIGDVTKAGRKDLADFLGNLSFARYRFRDLAPPPAPPATSGEPPPPAPPQDPDVAKVARVEREDIPTRLSGLAAFCVALARPGREPIVAALGARGLAADALTKLGDDAETLRKLGRNALRATEATATEAAAAGAQRAKWNEVRRMVRKAVRGEPTLETKYADC